MYFVDPYCWDISKERLMHEFEENWEKEYHLEFTIEVNKLPKNFVNVFEFTINGTIESRLPAFYINSCSPEHEFLESSKTQFPSQAHVCSF